MDYGKVTVKGEFKIPSGAGASKVLTSDTNGVGTWQAPAGGGGENLTKAITQVSHGLAVGNVIKFDGTDYVKAKADTGTNAEVVGIVSAVAGADDFTLLTSGYISGLSSLTAGTVYYLSASSAGALTSAEPSISKPVLIAVSTTTGYFCNFRGLTGGNSIIGFSSKARVYRNAAVNITNSWAKVEFDTENYDINSEFDIATNYRFAAAVSGYYQVNATLGFTATGADRAALSIRIDGTDYSGVYSGVGAAGSCGVNISDVVYLAAGSYIELWAYSYGGSRALLVGTTETWMSIHRLS